MSDTAEVVIVGAGIAGVAAAWHLAARRGVRDVVIVDERPPLSLTSDKSTECYRNLWPGPDATMVGLMNRSIDLMESIARETGNAIRMNRRGYLFATADPARADALARDAAESCALGAGTLRVHGPGSTDEAYRPAPLDGFEGQPDGADLVRDPALLRAHFPWLAEDTVAALHARRCGWFSAQQLGAWMLERAREAGARLVSGRVESVGQRAGRVESVTVASDAGKRTIACPRLVLAPGPLLSQALGMLDLELPVYCERHVKVAFRDERGGLPGDGPMMIWCDPVRLPWSADEREAIAADPGQRWLLDELPAGVHGRPEGAPGQHWGLVLWTYEDTPVEPTFPLEWDPALPEIALRGMAVMLPAMRRYFDHLPRPVVDGGYYCKAPDNRPVIGPLPVAGAWVTGAFSGYGLMAACGAGELLAAHVTGETLPPWGEALRPARFDDPDYARRSRDAARAGQI